MTGCPRVPRPSATLTGRYCYLPDPVRLACLIHATSVRSEPESNSQKKTSLRLARALRLAGRRPRREPSPSPLFSLSLVSRVPSGGSLGAPSETRSSSTISSQGSTSAPRRAVARWVANEDIVYQIPRGRARGKGHFSRKSFRGPAEGRLGGGRTRQARPSRARSHEPSGRTRQARPSRVRSHEPSGRTRQARPSRA